MAYLRVRKEMEMDTKKNLNSMIQKNMCISL
jgi:hypothetical protein